MQAGAARCGKAPRGRGSRCVGLRHACPPIQIDSSDVQDPAAKVGQNVKGSRAKVHAAGEHITGTATAMSARVKCSHAYAAALAGTPAMSRRVSATTAMPCARQAGVRAGVMRWKRVRCA